MSRFNNSSYVFKKRKPVFSIVSRNSKNKIVSIDFLYRDEILDSYFILNGFIFEHKINKMLFFRTC